MLKNIKILFLVVCTSFLYSGSTLAKGAMSYQLQYRQVYSTGLNVDLYLLSKKGKKAHKINFFFVEEGKKNTTNRFKSVKHTLPQSGPMDSLKLIENQLARIDRLFEGVPYWLATVYDQDSGGFYDNYSMKISSKYDPDIQSTFFGWKSLAVDGYLYQNVRAVPKMIREKVVQFIQSRQDSASGYFFDPLYKEKMKQNQRTMGRILGMAVSVLHSAGAEPLYPLPGAKNQKNRPSHLQSVKKYKEWLDRQNWNRVWTAFDQILSQGEAIRSLPKPLRDSIVSVTYSYAKKHQDEDGLWGENQDVAIRIGGANKLGGFLNKMGKSLPNPDLIYDSIIRWLKHSPPLSAKGTGCTICVPRNAIRVLYYVQPQLSHPIDYQDKLAIIKGSYRFMKYYRMSDGGFPKSRKKFILAPNDLHLGTTEIEQSDINGTHLMINMRYSLYQLLQISMPALPNRTDFMNYLPNYKFSR